MIYTTTSSTTIACWDDSLPKPGPVEIATTGHWAGKEFGLTGGPGQISITPKLEYRRAGTNIIRFSAT